MAITNAQQQNIIALTVGLFNAAPGADYLTELSEVFEANGNSYAALTDFIVSTPAFNAQYTGRVTVENKVATALNLLGVPAEGEAREEATAYFLERAEAGASEAEILLEAVTFLRGDVAEKYADIKAAFENKIEVATTYSVELQQSSTNLEELKSVVANVTSDPATVEEAEDAIVGGTGQTFTLTAATDNFTGTTGGTAGNDRFIGDNSGTNTVNAADQLDGAGGRDVFDYYGADGTVPVMQNIEVLNLHGAAANMNVTDAEGLEEAWLIGASTANGLTTAVSAGVTAGLRNINENTQTFTFANAAAATAVLENATIGTQLNLDNGTGTNLQTLNLVSTGSALPRNTIRDLESNGTATTLNVSGDQGLTISDALEAGVRTVNASEATGGVSVNVSAKGGAATVTGGTGDDAVYLGAALTIADVLNGGEGTDIIGVTDGATLVDNLQVSGFETLDIGGAGANATAFDVSKLTGITTLKVGAATVATNAVTVNNLAKGASVELNSALNNNLAVNVKDAGANSPNDVIDVLVKGSTAVTTANSLIIDNIETVNLSADKGTATGSVTHTASILKVDAASTVNVEEGNAGLTIGALDAVNLVEFNASAATQAVNVTVNNAGTAADFTATSGVGFTLGQGNDTLDLNSAATKGGGFVVEGGKGGDTIDLVAGSSVATFDNATVVFGEESSFAGNDASGNARFDTITNFTTGVDKIDLTEFGFSGSVLASLKVNANTSINATTGEVNAASTANFFGAGGDQRAVAIVDLGDTLAENTWVYVDTNGDGSFQADTDLAIQLAGVGANDPVLSDFTFA